MKQIKISPESWVLIAIGTADLVTTVLWIRQGNAQEANPLFKYYLNQGLLAFIVAKYVCLLGPILVMEWARRYKPRFVQWALRGAVLAYVGLYGLGVARVNNPEALAETNQSRWEVRTTVVHGWNGKTHILLSGLPDEYYAFPSPRQQLMREQDTKTRPSARHHARPIGNLPLAWGLSH
ncbi:MAG TPA: DUF5658 family protein [Chthonomonadaceae bacterium]|nr:DUF5658 family protein [Chthonomonadaceae bacterium]